MAILKKGSIPAATVLLLAVIWQAAWRDGSTADADQNSTIRRVARQQRPSGNTGNRSRATTENAIAAERASAPVAQADFPATAVTRDGAVWVAYLAWDREQTDRVVVRRKGTNGQWSEPIALDDGCFEHYIPALAARGENLFAVWSGHNEDGFDLYATEITPDGNAGNIERLTDAPHSDFNVVCASDAGGNVTIAWQSFRGLQSDVYARRLSGDTWGDETRISTAEANDWEPDVAIDSQGVAWISWDGYEHGNYDVFLRSFDGGQAGERIAVATEPSAQFHTSLAVDSKDRVWVAWDDGGINWGKDFSRASRVKGSRGLHFSRKIALRVVEGGLVHDVQADVRKIMQGRMNRYHELPHIAFDGSGTLWMVFRHWTLRKPHEIYHFYATKLTGDGWTEPVQLANSSGRNTQHAGLALGADGALRVAYSSDGRGPGIKPKDAVHALSYVTYLASLPRGGTATDVDLEMAELPEPQSVEPPERRQTYRAGDEEYTLMFGDCHRHTDIRGHSGVDASALDTYRYALDAAQLDFLGLGDHNQVTGGVWPDGLRDYQWWYQQKFTDLFTHAPKFIGVYSYEHSLGRPSGHRNILHLKRGAPMRVADRRGGGRDNPDNQPPNLWDWMENNVLTQPGQEVVIVPHTFAAGPLADWNWPNADFDCLLEIYQGTRGSYEAWNLPDDQERGPTQTDKKGHFARDALRKGNVYGFVSFSDHYSTHNSWAGVWVEEPSREALFDAMLKRRTFAGSDEIILRACAKDSAAGRAYPVGSHITADADSPLTFQLDIEAQDRILRVDLVRDGKYIYTKRPGDTRTFSATYTDMQPQQGESYYYVRIFQRDPEKPDGDDPEIAWASPFFVTYE